MFDRTILCGVFSLLVTPKSLPVVHLSSRSNNAAYVGRRFDDMTHDALCECPHGRPLSSATAMHAAKFKNFDEMLTTFPNSLILVSFSAKWCGPCQLAKKELDSVHQALGDGIKIFTIDTEKWPSLGARYNVEGLPCAVLFKGGKILHRWEGLEAADNIVRDIEAFL